MNNKELIQHGILEDESDIRVHVCPVAGIVYVFPTEEAKKLAETGLYRLAKKSTSEGYLIPPGEFKKLKRIRPGLKFWEVLNLKSDDDESVKGRKAEKAVSVLIIRRKFPEMGFLKKVTDREQQIKGIDLIISAKTVQVKCDFEGGEGNAATGNLYIELKESNIEGKI